MASSVVTLISSSLQSSNWFKPILWKTEIHEGTHTYIYPCNRPWSPIGLWDIEAPTFSRKSAHRWPWSCQPYAPAALYPSPTMIPGTHFCWSVCRPQGYSAAGWIRSIEESNDIGNRTRDLVACSIVPETSTLPRAHIYVIPILKFPHWLQVYKNNILYNLRQFCNRAD
jgi:hypothetical protein